MAGTLRADVGRDQREVEISSPVAEGMRAAEGKYCKCAGVVDGYVAGYAC